MLLRLFFLDGFQTPAKERGYLERKTVSVRNNLPILHVLAFKLSTAGMPDQVGLCDGIGLVSCLDTGAIFHKCDASCDMPILQLLNPRCGLSQCTIYNMALPSCKPLVTRRVVGFSDCSGKPRDKLWFHYYTIG